MTAPDKPAADQTIIGQSAPMQTLFRDLAQVMNSDMSVWISGESGTGKSLIARTLHDLSDRRVLPFVVIGPQDLTGDDAHLAILTRASGGTILLDRIDDFNASTQQRALWLLDTLAGQRGDWRARVVATAHAGPGAPELREDLYYRLAGAVITVPPLRARVGDIPLLMTHFLGLAEMAGGHARRVAPDALVTLCAHDWPGNLRELENAACRLALVGRAPVISQAEVSALLTAHTSPTPASTEAGQTLGSAVAAHIQRYFDLHGQMLPPPGLYARILREIEAPLLRIALEAVAGNQVKCAEILGINRNTLRKKMSALDIEVTRDRKLM